MAVGWRRTGWTWFSNATTAYGVLPSAGVALVTGGLAYFGELSAAVIVVIGLLAFAAALAIFRYSPSIRNAWFGIGIILALGLALAIWQSYKLERDYKLDFDEMRLGLIPLNLNRSMAQGATVEATFINPNDFDIWLKSDRRISSINIRTSGTDAGIHIEKIRRLSRFVIADEPIEFGQPLNEAEVAEGSLDFHICYGKSKDAMTKSLTIAGTFATQFESGKIMAAFHETMRKEGLCDAE